jgi:hypothetical protein
MSFTTVDEVALMLNRDKLVDLSTMELTQINMLIPYIDGVINNYCGWNLLSTDYTDSRFDGNGTSIMDLRLYPVNTLTQLRIKDTSTGLFTDYTTDIEILSDGLIQFDPSINSGGTFTLGTKNIYVSFNAGYVDIPSDLAYAASYLVSINFNNVINETIGLAEESFEQKTQKYSSLELPLVTKLVLDRYRLVSIF